MLTRAHVGSFLGLAAGFVGLALVGCGGGAPPSGAKSAEPPTTVDAAETRLTEAERDVRLALGLPPDAPTGAAAGQPPLFPAVPGAAPPPPAQAGAEAAPAKRPADAIDVSAASKSPDPCVTACSALGSMQRAADGLCGLSGESDARCESARVRLKTASDQVHLRCSACR